MSAGTSAAIVRVVRMRCHPCATCHASTSASARRMNWRSASSGASSFTTAMLPRRVASGAVTSRTLLTSTRRLTRRTTLTLTTATATASTPASARSSKPFLFNREVFIRRHQRSLQTSSSRASAFTATATTAAAALAAAGQYDYDNRAFPHSVSAEWFLALLPLSGALVAAQQEEQDQSDTHNSSDDAHINNNSNGAPNSQQQKRLDLQGGTALSSFTASARSASTLQSYASLSKRNAASPVTLSTSSRIVDMPLLLSPRAPVASSSSSATSMVVSVNASSCEPRNAATKLAPTGETLLTPIDVGTTHTSTTTTTLHRMASLRGRGLDDKYKVEWDTVLGEGAYGAVHPARLRATGEKVALKKINRRYTSSSSFQQETDALLRIFDNGGHPNISGLRDIYEDHNFYYLILDLVTGGEMFEHLIHYGAYSEADAARVMHEIASALAFLHGVGVSHGDLKPENLLLSTKNRLDGTIKMIDFGCAVVRDIMHGEDTDPNSQTNIANKTSLKSASSTGTTAYWPRERFEKGIMATPAMDMWSVGVILYIMLTGVHPFDVQGVSTDAEIEAHIRADPQPPLTVDLVGHLSESAVDLILKLMETDPLKRITAYDMLHHPWVRGETALKEKMQDSDKKLSRFKDLRYKLEAGMFAVLVSQGHFGLRLSEAKVQKKTSERDDATTHIMQRAFAVFDAAGKGFVTSDDLGRVTSERTGAHLSSTDTQEFLATHSGSPSAAAAVSLSQFHKLFSGLHQKHYPRGHYIFHAGEPGNSMYFLSSGKVEIQTRKGQLVSILRSGDFFGEGCLLDKDRGRYTSAKCATPVDVIEIKREDFDRYVGASQQAKHDLMLKWRARSLHYAKNLLRLQKNLRVRHYRKGDVVYREGDIGTSMFQVDENEAGGELAVSHGNNVVHKYVGGDTFGESSLLFKRPRSSTVTCVSDTCRLLEMKGEDFMALVDSSPEMAASLRNMCRKRLFKRAVKAHSLEKKRGVSDDDIVAAFHEIDVDRNGTLGLDDVRRLMHRMDPKYPMDEIRALLQFVDVDEDGQVSLEEFKRLFRQFEDEKVEIKPKP